MKKITDELIFDFKNYLIEEEKSKNTIEKYLRDITFFHKWIGNEEINKITVLEYKKHLNKKYIAKSVNSVISSLNSFFEFMNWHDIRIKNIKIQKQIFLSQEKELTKEEYNKLLLTAKKKGNRKLFLLMQTICSTGIRVSELKFITVSSVKNGQADIDCKGKSRRVIIPDKLCKILRKYITEEKISDGSVFISKKGNPLDRSNIWKLMKSLCEEAGVKKDKVFPHNLRHLFARTYYSLQKDIVRLADILGHTNVETTRIYTMESGDVHRKQIQKLGLLMW